MSPYQYLLPGSGRQGKEERQALVNKYIQAWKGHVTSTHVSLDHSKSKSPGGATLSGRYNVDLHVWEQL